MMTVRLEKTGLIILAGDNVYRTDSVSYICD
jgi:hypothetical protein